MRLVTITQLVSDLIGKQYTTIIDVAIHTFERDMAVKFNDLQIQRLACKAQSLYDLFDGNGNPYSIEDRQEIMKHYLCGTDVSLYVATMDEHHLSA